MLPSVVLEQGGAISPWVPGLLPAPFAAIGAASATLNTVPAPPGKGGSFPVILQATGGNCWYVVDDPASTPTAVSGTGTRLPAGQSQLVRLARGQTVAVIRDTSSDSGTLYCILPGRT